jgi:hypothetical protein
VCANDYNIVRFSAVTPSRAEWVWVELGMMDSEKKSEMMVEVCQAGAVADRRSRKDFRIVDCADWVDQNTSEMPLISSPGVMGSGYLPSLR